MHPVCQVEMLLSSQRQITNASGAPPVDVREDVCGDRREEGISAPGDIIALSQTALTAGV